MTIIDVFGGCNYKISCDSYHAPAIMHVPGRFWRRPHDKQIQESWTIFNITDKRTSKVVFSVRCSTRLINIEIYVNGEQQDTDFITRNDVLHDVIALHSLNKTPTNTKRLQQNRDAYTQIYNTLRKQHN